MRTASIAACAALVAALVGCPVPDDDDDATPFDPSGLPQGADAPREPSLATVVDVFDGDTAEVEIEGFTETVRFLNIDTPEVGDCWASNATARTHELMPEGSEVWLTWDGELRDGFGRYLCHLFAGEAPTEDDWVNLALVREGHARAFIFEENDTYRDRIEDAQAAAQSEGAGLWGQCE